ncbi:hypothetical protein B0919_08715 [Hymenobacter sp. CRA2]|nr:hypothetical protein B0919_08715 [Hymenobacter sp. CRA2]
MGLPLRLLAQVPAAGQAYTDARAGYRLVYPRDWQVYQSDTKPPVVSFYAGEEWAQAQAAVSLTIRPVPARRLNLNLLAAGQADSVWQGIMAQPQARVLRLEQHDAGTYQEIRYDYTYAATGGGRTHVLGRQLWRGGYAFELEYRAVAAADGRHLAAGRQLLESFVFAGKGLPSRRYAEQPCDDKMYGIAALRFHNGQWEDDCRTIHEFSVSRPSTAPKQHRLALPFQSYALAKGFDNCLYAVTKSPTDAPELVYRYNPATHTGEYTPWRLPRQGSENVWISAATDERGDLYFITSSADLLVRVSPATDSVSVVWAADPLRKTPYYAAIGFPGAGTHANFCIDDDNALYEVYSTDGSLLKIDLTTRRPGTELMQLGGLPERGGYSDLLVQRDAAGRRRLYLAGPKALYDVDLNLRQATQVRKGIYTDLAGCNVFRSPAKPVTAPRTPSTALWRGRVLDAVTYQPLPQAQLRLRGTGGPEITVQLTPQGTFAVGGQTGYPYVTQVQLAGYLSVDSLYTLAPGASVQDILLRPLNVGTTLSLDKVQFEQGQAALLSSSTPALDQLVVLLTNNPGMTIELRGHTDNVGDPQKNVELSQQRVAAVKAYLVNHGIAEGRITGIGLGGAEPRASNAQEATRQLNRRVEFRVTGR